MINQTTPPYNVQIDQAQTEVLRLLADKYELINQRNKLVDKPFFLFRWGLKKMVKELDQKLNSVDDEIQKSMGIVLKGKKIVRASSLTIRFYRCDGWTRQCLEAYIDDGQIHDSHLLFNDVEDESYFVIDKISKISCELLYKYEVSSIIRTFNDSPDEDDKTYFCRVLADTI